MTINNRPENNRPDMLKSNQWSVQAKGEVLVSCIMPTHNRPGYVSQSVGYFLAQDYPYKELVIIYDEPGDLPKDLPGHPSIRCYQVGRGKSIGFKRNLACQVARGLIIAQWDDDDWYSSHRLTVQVQPILDNKGDMTALNHHLFLELDKSRFWMCSESLYSKMFVQGVAGGTLVYRSSLRIFHVCEYPDTSLREDADFMMVALKRGAKLVKMDGYSLYIYLRHGKNSWSFVPGSFLDPMGWKTVDMPEFFVPDAAFYRLTVQGKAGGVKEPAVSTPGIGDTHGPARVPKVSCIMPTADRRELVRVAIENFLAQGYANKELVIIDDGHERIDDLLPREGAICYQRIERGLTVGEKRNLACALAQGEIIIHWDDDDWRSDQWIGVQVRHLLEGKADITGLDQPYFYNPYLEQAWQYIYPKDDGRNWPAWVHGGTLCYWKSFWKSNPFPKLNIGEDVEFLWSRHPKRVVPHRGIYLYVAFIHDRNASPKHTWNSRFFQRETSVVRRFIGNHYSRYCSALASMSRTCFKNKNEGSK